MQTICIIIYPIVRVDFLKKCVKPTISIGFTEHHLGDLLNPFQSINGILTNHDDL